MEKIGRYKPGQNVTVRPNGELAGDQLRAGRFVAVTGYGDDRCYLADHAEAGDPHPFGVTQRDSAKPNVEDAASVDLLVEVQRGGVPFVEAGEAIDADPPVDIAVGTDGKAVVAGGSVGASLVTDKVADNNAILWTARDGGPDGNDLTVAILNTGKEKALSVDVDGDDIIVTAATNNAGAGEITSTAAQVEAAILEHDVASQLVTAVNSGASSGAGVVAAVAETPLAGGSDTEGPTAVVGKALTSAEEAGDFIEVDLY
jgi:hypothetical protein